MSFHLPKIYPITDTALSSLSHTEQVKRLVAGGATLIQLREKNNSGRAFYADAADAIRIARLTGANVIINDRIDVALALGAYGVHLGQTDMPVTAARCLLGDDSIIGFSTHNIEQVKARKGPIIVLTSGDGSKRLKGIADDVIEIPRAPEFTAPVLTAIPLQLFAYHVAVELGRDVDKPRNLAKSVTVE